ncbi:MAG TPA: mechanosensitive ion channel family protein [Povalibacter sp.]|uniref:mechanosensitive ion channel family protein n=1 Tax=Povalibacter sp. TaxID=1962978 RepID=UPI002CED97D4|nr:mechanosensitive ion channel family protein [Povalibacter sp.]HMN45496.1 mechanosensitive ion channel family protein [Povalibacter sp.]
MIDLNELSRMPLFDNSLLQWLIATAVAVAVFAVLMTARRVIRTYHKRLKETPKTEILELPLEVLSRTTLLFFLVVALYSGLKTLTVGARGASLMDSVITIASFWQAGVWAVAAASAYIDRKRRASMTADRAAVGSLSIIAFIINVVIWALVAMLTLENLGVDITALVAGLGIGGIAVALAVQNVLGDLFASLSITLDRPFVVGDFLIVDDFLGSVEYIGIKSTRLRSLSGEQIIMANSDLLGSRVRNYGRMNERRVVFPTRVTYETPVELVEKVPALIRRIVEEQNNTRFDRSHFQKHAPGSLDFETVYYVLSADYNKYMDVQQAINLALHREFAKLGIEFAYPTQKLYVAGVESTEPDRTRRAA